MPAKNRDPNQVQVHDLSMPEESKADIEVRSRHESGHIQSDIKCPALLLDVLDVLQI